MDLELLVLGDKGWGDEMLRATLVTLMVSLSGNGHRFIHFYFWYTFKIIK